MRRTKPVAAPMVARVYLRVSTDAQDLERQEAITTAAKAAGYYVAGIYREKASGARADRPELLRMIGDLQPGEVVIAEKIDRISRLPLPEAERPVASIQAKGARPAVPAWSIYPTGGRGPGVAKIVLEAVQIMLFRPALQMARDDYEDRRERQRQGIELARRPGGTRAAVLIRSAAPKLSRCASPATASTRPPSWPGTVRPVKRIWAEVSQPKRSSTARSWRTH
ncbi:resolvase [Escherichia coli]|nr:resolvase [Escherichia coli]